MTIPSSNSTENIDIQELEENRKKQIQTSKKAMYFCYPLGILALVLIFSGVLGGFFYLVVGGLFGLPTLIKISMRKGITSLFKQNFIIPALTKLRPNLNYFPGDGVSLATFNKSNLFANPDRYSGEDLFQGIHHKTSFSFSEVHAEKKHENKNSSSYSNIFKGLFMVADFNKHIKNETYVFTKGGKWFSKFKRVRLENPDFEDNFKVYSDNAIEARYILTPSLMMKILELERTFNAQLFLSFIGSNIYIALENSNNYFEPNLDSEITVQMVEGIVAEIDACVGIIDELDLNTRIWTKE